MKQIFRNFIHVVKRFKTSSILNMLGLSAAFAVFIVVMMQVYYDFRFNRSFTNANDIALFSLKVEGDSKNSTQFPATWAREIAGKIPGIEKHGLSSPSHYSYRYNDTKYDLVWIETTPGFMDIFEPEVLEGDINFSEAPVGKVIISQSIAKQLFGNESAVGKVIIDHWRNNELTVEAVIKDYPANSSMYQGVYTYISEEAMSKTSGEIYFQLNAKSRDGFNKSLLDNGFLDADRLASIRKTVSEVEPKLIPLTDIHLFATEVGGGAINTTLSLLTIAIVIMLIAYINFINFSIAMAPARVRTLNIQKILGANKQWQQIILMSESACFSFLAFLIGLLLTFFVSKSGLQDMLSANLSLDQNIPFILIMATVSIIIGIFFGIYPAHRITSFEVVDAIKGNVASSKASSKLRNTLITLQFLAAILLIIVASFTKIQHNYVSNYEWGMDKKQVAYFSMAGRPPNTDVLGNELLKNTHITNYSVSNSLPGRLGSDMEIEWEGKQVKTVIWQVEDRFLDLFHIELAAGNNFTDTEKSENVKLIFNERFLSEYGYTHDIIGKNFPYGGKMAQIVGIAKDINFESLKEPIRPMAFATLSKPSGVFMFVKLTGTDTKKTLDYIKSTWGKFSKEAITINFLDEVLNDRLYKQEDNLAQLLTISSIIAILIAIMGVYGLITFNSKYRAREIAVRKVNGAEEKEIILMLNKGMLVQLLLGFVIATPLAYYIVNKWLEQFAYKTTIYWWIFALGGLIILLITVLTVSVQSYRAAIENPVKALKSE